MAIPMKDITKIPIEKATKPFDGALVMTNRWWIVLDNCILFYRKHSPQCNSDKRIVERSLQKLYPSADVIFIPVVYTEHNCYDY